MFESVVVNQNFPLQFLSGQFWMRVVLLRPEGVEIYVEWEQRAAIAEYLPLRLLSGEFGGRIVNLDPKA